MTWKNKKIIFGTIGFLAIGGGTTLTILLLKDKDKSSSKTKINAVKLTKASFEIGGTETLGTINLKSNISLPKQTELRYFLGGDVPNNDKSYTLNKPTNLKNGDTIHIKLFVKKANALTYELDKKFTNVVSIRVSGLSKIVINSNLLKTTSFSIIGFHSKGTIKLNDNLTLPKEVETRYFKGSSAPQDDSIYKKAKPKDLSNGDKVFVKFFVKRGFIETHMLKNNFTNPIEFIANSLPIKIDTSKLNQKSFAFLVNNGRTTVQWRSNIILPSEVEIKYHTITSKFDLNYNPSDSQYSTTNPTNLLDNAIIYVKFFIKDPFRNTHQFPNNFVDTRVFKNILTPYIQNSDGGLVFEDSQGNIWAMGRGERLYALKKINGFYAESWNHSTTSGLTKGSNITNGYLGTIFEDRQGNLWSMGNSRLQVLAWNDETQQYADSWSHSTRSGLTKGSKITIGFHGIIFQDRQGNLWAMARDNKLQVLAWNSETQHYAESWSDSTTSGLTKASNITKGRGGTIFQDRQGNLWSMGNSRLQVLAWNDETQQYADSWSHSTRSGLTKGSNIKDGYSGTILQDRQGNLWSMANKPVGISSSKLQVLAWNSETQQYAESWSDSTTSGLTKGSNITDGFFGVIIQDSLGNLWAMSSNRKLQVLAWNSETQQYAKSWSYSTGSGLTKGSKIKSGSYGTIFEDSSGNLWSIGKRSKLQVLVRKDENSYVDSWTDDSNNNKLLKGSRGVNGINWKFFEDSRGNIWATGYNKKIQVFDQKRGIWNQETLTQVDTSKLNTESFEIVVNNGRATMRWRSDVELPNEVEIKYHLITTKLDRNYNPSDNLYDTRNPMNFQSNAIIYVKFFIKNAFKNTHQFPNNFIKVKVFQFK